MKHYQLLKVSLMIIAILAVIGADLWSQPAPISFRVENVLSHVPGPPPSTPWMFDLDSPGYFTHDGNPFTYKPDDNDNSHNFAYFDFTSIGVPGYTSFCTAENLDNVQGTDGFDITFADFTLRGFHKVNTENPNLPWNTPGQAGDVRTYIGGLCEVWHKDALVLRVIDCVLRVEVCYPSAQQIRLTTGMSPDQWSIDVGTGEPTEVTGWGTLDIAHSDPIWAASFTNFQAGNRIEFEMSSMDMVMQGQLGFYDFDIDLVPAPFAIEMDHANILGIGQYEVQYLGFDYDAVEQGGPHGDLNDLVVLEHDHQILGGLPEAVDEVHPKLWQFATTLESFTANISFDLSGYGFGNSSDWLVLRKPDHQDTWEIWPNVSYLDENVIRANGVTAFSDWAIGKAGDQTLPVQLSSFTAIPSVDNAILIQWTTQSESALSGFRVFRAMTADLGSASIVSPHIPGTNSSTTCHYSFRDDSVLSGNNYSYWLQQLDMDGDVSYHGPISLYYDNQEDSDAPPVDLNTGFRRVYPNPGSNSSIEVCLAKALEISVDVYNLKGQKVKTVFRGSRDQGQHSMYWDGSDDAGQALPSGLYYITMSSKGKKIEQRKISLIK